MATTAGYIPSPASESGSSRLRRDVIFWSITSSLAGFIFGFDTVVISGAEQTIQRLWSLSAGVHGLVMASALYGTVLGSLIGAWPADRFGRKPTLLWVGLLYFVSMRHRSRLRGSLAALASASRLSQRQCTSPRSLRPRIVAA
jgi:MFS family permease